MSETETASEPVFSRPMASQLPVPSTYHLLCAIPNAEKEYESGILKADTVAWREELLTPVLFVMAMGPDAFADKTRFPSGPACKVGDFVLVRPNTGTRIKIHKQEFRIIADESVEATIADPRGCQRPNT